jgi:hypothetical protein
MTSEELNTYESVPTIGIYDVPFLDMGLGLYSTLFDEQNPVTKRKTFSRLAKEPFCGSRKGICIICFWDDGRIVTETY